MARSSLAVLENGPSCGGIPNLSHCSSAFVTGHIDDGPSSLQTKIVNAIPIWPVGAARVHCPISKTDSGASEIAPGGEVLWSIESDLFVAEL